MSVRVTIEIPQALYDRLRQRAESTGISIGSLIVRDIAETYTAFEVVKKGERLTGPLIIGKGKRGPRYPVDENPYDRIFP
jgi:hypothetical protein